MEVDQLQPGVANRLNDGIRVDDMEAAEALVKEYEDEIAQKNDNAAEGGETQDDAKDGDDKDTQGGAA